MQKRSLGNTSILVSPIGLGTVKWGRNQSLKFKNPFTLPTYKSLKSLIDTAREYGINFLDTAPAYGDSEKIIGKLLKTDRKNWIISSKAGEKFIEGKSYFDFSKNAIKKQIDESLRILNTEWLDILLIHSNGDDKTIIEHYEVFDTLAEMKKTGKIRAYGMSTKTLLGTHLTLQYADIVMVTYNILDQSERKNIAKAYTAQKGILIKKALASGHLDKINTMDPVKAAMQFIFKTQGISSVLVGTINIKHLVELINKSDLI